MSGITITLPQELVSQSWWREPKTVALFLHILVGIAQGERGSGRIQTNEYKCSMRDLAGKSGLTLKETRIGIQKILTTGWITKRDDTRGTIWGTTLGTENVGRKQGLCVLEGHSLGHSSQGEGTVGEKKDVGLTLDRKREIRSEIPVDGHTLLVEQPPLHPPLCDNKSLEVNPPISPPYSPPPLSPSKPAKQPRESAFLTVQECYELICQHTPSERVREAALGWIKMRYAKRGDHRCTRRALESAMSKARRLAATENQAVAVFEQSEERCWDGLFEVRG